jgi:hypothetical protein
MCEPDQGAAGRARPEVQRIRQEGTGEGSLALVGGKRARVALEAPDSQCQLLAGVCALTVAETMQPAAVHGIVQDRVERDSDSLRTCRAEVFELHPVDLADDMVGWAPGSSLRCLPAGT